MGLSNLEFVFRKKMQSRTIQPSENSWDRLNAMLSFSEKVAPKNKYKWLYIAASFIGFLFIGIVYFSQKTEKSNTNQPVVLEHKKESLIPKIKISGSASKALVNSDLNRTKNEIKKTATNLNDLKVNTNLIMQSNGINKQSFINQKTEQDQFINLKQTVVTEIKNQSETEPEKILIANLKATGLNVNPNHLLLQVNGELENNFRESILQKISKNYQSVKVALENRNQLN